MKPVYILCLLLSVALAAVSWKYVQTVNSQEKTEVVADSTNATMQTILTRASVRSYTPQSVEKEKIDLLLRAGMSAPTSRDARPWHFVVVTDTAVIHRMATTGKASAAVGRARLVIVVCGNLKKALEGPGQQYWIQDCSNASENILLAAHALGLGAVWTSVYPKDEKVAAIRSVLNLPQYMIPLNAIAIGYPQVKATVKNKYNPGDITYNDRFREPEADPKSNPGIEE